MDMAMMLRTGGHTRKSRKAKAEVTDPVQDPWEGLWNCCAGGTHLDLGGPAPQLTTGFSAHAPEVFLGGRVVPVGRVLETGRGFLAVVCPGVA